ncbi:DUF3397 domain-containing protein [Streptococcus oricebi]|uniref:DUF3397 domain-containing protein n=1 Tax=Streptococcus oricebi TaxID=1547447 RepID=A0ABS5B211_9STRE|nr:DUF3397 domain-containing protein [Streptococcus oricebi]MBP2622870.1 DUF3397 domain-containing protein [Streptococcus oricebi]
MILLKISAVLFVFLTPLVTIIISRFFNLKKFGLNFADLAFPLFVLELYFITDKAYYHSFLPQLVLALGLLAIAITIYFLKKKRSFYYPKFFKFFWRAGFILTFLMYLAIVIGLFLKK